MFETTDPKQLFFVANQIELFPQDEEILIKLYQPMISSIGTALYQTLIQDYHPQTILSDAKGLYTLQEQLDCGLKDLFLALHKLEAVGLVQTYLVKTPVDQRMVFKLRKVPNAQQFFSDSLLATLLKEKIGEQRFYEVSHYFSQQSREKDKQINDLEDVSATFFEVFRLPGNEAISPTKTVRQAAKDNNVKAAPTAEVSSWDYMKYRFGKYHIPTKEIDNQRAEIIKVIRMYGLTEDEFVDETIPALHGSNKLNMPLIERVIAENYKSLQTQQFNRKRLANNSGEKVQSGHEFSEKERRLLVNAKLMAPAEFLIKFKESNGWNVAPREHRVLHTVMNLGFSSALINMAIYGNLLTDSVITDTTMTRILNDWTGKKNNIHTPEDALRHIKKRNEKKSQRTYYRPRYKRVEKGTDWSKKTANMNAKVDTEELKNFFKKLENKNKDK